MPITGFVWRVGASGGGLFDINFFLILFWYLKYGNKLSINFKLTRGLDGTC